MQTIFWHDYETFGADPQKDRPSQFAGIRTDHELNIIGEPVTIFCRPADDFLPAPDACLITGITPQQALKDGVIEAEFCQQINDLFSVPNTCVAGYNSIRFDDEVTRNLLYRNFYDPYEREWKNGNSRWDLIDVVRLTHALRPEGINWPVGADGKVSFRLELLTAANGIEHLAAHDAMSDVYATIALAKLIKQRQPKLYEYAFALRDKARVLACLDVARHKPVFHVSSMFPATLGCCALLAPLFQHPVNKNAYVGFDLRQNPEVLSGLSVDELRMRLYSSAEDLGNDKERPALKAIHINKCPMLAPAAVLDTLAEERRKAWLLDKPTMLKHLDYLRANQGLVEKFKEIYEGSQSDVEVTDPDLMIYRGGFFAINDKREMERVKEGDPMELGGLDFNFHDARLPEMLFRYRARNYPQTLSSEERERWETFRAQRLLAEKSDYLTFDGYMRRLSELTQDSALSDSERNILLDLQCYAESILPYY